MFIRLLKEVCDYFMKSVAYVHSKHVINNDSMVENGKERELWYGGKENDAF